MENRKDQIAMWRRYDKNGREYYSVSVEIQGVKTSFNAFQNNKSNDKQPDFKGDSYKTKTLPDGWGEKSTGIKSGSKMSDDPAFLTELDIPF